MYTTNFKNLVDKAYSKSTDFYGAKYPFSESRNYEPNPFFIGFGNPNSKILLIGKEKGFDASSQHKNYTNSPLFLESIANPDDWKKIIENKIDPKNYKYYLDSTHYKNAFLPYTDKKPDGGHTWNKYQKLINYIDKPDDEIINSFFLKSFITEVNFRPSKLSTNPKEFGLRLDFLKHPFYQSFPIVILACGNYLSKMQIENIFDVKFETNKNTAKRKKLIEYQNKSKIVINTRQLSMDINEDYLELISKIATDNTNQ